MNRDCIHNATRVAWGLAATGALWLGGALWAKHAKRPASPLRTPVSQLLTVLEVEPWLLQRLNRPALGLSSAYLFGSIVHPYASNDVDLLVLFNTDVPAEIKKRAKAIRKMSRGFHDRFNVPLHVTPYAVSESSRADQFLGKNTVRKLL